MRTIKSTGPLLYSVKTDHKSSIPKGKVRAYCVRYEVYEFDDAEFDKTSFTIHDANSPEALELSKIFKV